MNTKNDNILKKVVFLLFSIFFLIGLATFKDYGMSVDEEFQRSSGLYWLNYVLNFTPFENFKSTIVEKISQIETFTLPTVESHPFYGVIFDLPVAFLETTFQIEDPKNYFYLRHFLNFLLFFISSIFFFKLLMNRFSSNSISIMGTLFYVLSPRIYGNSFYNNKDILLLSLLTIALYFCFRVFDKKNFKSLLVFSFFAAICTCARINGIFLVFSFLIFYSLLVFSNKKHSVQLLPIIGFCFLYFFVIIVLWPALWNDPINNFITAFKSFSNFNLHTKMLFAGKYVSVHYLPSSYIFIWIFITTPILYTTLFVFGYFLTLRRFFTRLLNVENNKNFYDFWRSVNEQKDLFILFNITIIILYLIIFNTPLYNGWRHIYFLNVFIIYIAIVAFYQIDIYLRRKFKKKFHYQICILLLITIIYKMIIYHPFQNIYFNNYFEEISHKNFEIDYWGLSGKKFLEEILVSEKNENVINIGVAAWLPLERSINLLDKDDRERIKIVGQNFQIADYLLTNFISEVDKNFDDKYKIPSNFTKIDEFVLDDIKVYEVFKKKELSD